MYCGPANAQSQNALIDGLARQAMISHELPIPITKLCARYQSEAFYWVVGKEKLEYLLSRDAAEMSNCVIKIENFHFYLNLRNDRGGIVFECVPLHTPAQCREQIYCELYCVETRSQHKGTFLFNTQLRDNPRRRKNPRLHREAYPHVQWSPKLLSADECRHRQRLTFAFYANILSETSRQMRFPEQIEYRWQLKVDAKSEITKAIKAPRVGEKSACDKYSKRYSANFADDSWCLWSQPSKANSRSEQMIGLQLLKLPVQSAQGVMFECSVEWDGSDRATEFTYFLDWIHSDVEIRNIPSSASWVSVAIRCE